MKMLSRNTPIAFVVGAGGFLGSHLVEELLSKKIQVVGIDNFSTGKQANLAEASKDKNLYLLSQPAAQKLPTELPRLDYAFFIINDQLPLHEYLVSLDSFLDECKEFRPKIVMVSSLDLYDPHGSDHPALREAEKRLAQYVIEKKINARVIRLAAIYGPRMHFHADDPMHHLIKAAVKEELQKEVDVLDFTTRSLYVEDAINLLIKTVMHGSTALKIYDGSLLYPVKVAEVKQVLLDPIWHESRGFVPTELPPWPSPNLEKTMKELSWNPQVSLVEGLKKTLCFFKENPDLTEEVRRSDQSIGKKIIGDINKTDNEKENEEPKKNLNVNLSKFSTRIFSSRTGNRVKNYFLIFVGLAVIFYSLIFPVVSLAVLAVHLNSYLKQSSESFSIGNISAAAVEANLAKRGVENLQETLKALDFITQIGIGKNQFQNVSELIQTSSEAAEAMEHGTTAVTALSNALKTVSGEQEGSSLVYFMQANEEFEITNRLLGLVVAQLSDESYQRNFPGFMKDKMNEWRSRAISYKQAAEYGQSFSYLLSQLISVDGKKEYLVVLLDNSTLRPGGGVAVATAQVSFNSGKLVNIQSDSVVSLDQAQSEKITPPEDLVKDLKQTTWLMRDSSFEADGPSNGKLLQWFYNQNKGVMVDGVFVMDVTTVNRLLTLFGPISLANSEVINSQNFADKITTSTDSGKMAANVLKELLQRLFFLSKHNWLDLTNTLGTSFDEKHLEVYLSDPTNLSYFQSKNWIGLMPRQTKEGKGERNTFLATSEINIGIPGSNQKLKREYLLEDSLKLSGEVFHKLTIKYISGSNSKYDYRLRVYLASGSKLEKVGWGEDNIFSSVGSFSDYGLAGYSIPLSLSSGESKILSLEYTDGTLLSFEDNKLRYHLDLVKQPGTEKDSLEYKIIYPIEFKAIDDSQQKNPLVFSTDFSHDRSFETHFQK